MRGQTHAQGAAKREAAGYFEHQQLHRHQTVLPALEFLWYKHVVRQHERRKQRVRGRHTREMGSRMVSGRMPWRFCRTRWKVVRMSRTERGASSTFVASRTTAKATDYEPNETKSESRKGCGFAKGIDYQNGVLAHRHAIVEAMHQNLRSGDRSLRPAHATNHAVSECSRTSGKQAAATYRRRRMPACEMISHTKMRLLVSVSGDIPSATEGDRLRIDAGRMYVRIEANPAAKARGAR
jgi:hypothetical protein